MLLFQFFFAPDEIGFLHAYSLWASTRLIQTDSGVIYIWRFSCAWKGEQAWGGGGEGKEGVFFFFLSLSIEQGHLQCTTVCEQSYGLWYHLAIMDGLCCLDLTGQWTTSGCRWSAPRLPCIKKGWKIKLSVAIVDIFTPCLEVPMATEAVTRWWRWEICSVETELLAQKWTLSVCNHPL